MIKLENENLSAQISAQGAELVSLTDKYTGKQYIWQADKNIWARHAPVLFPIVGKLKDGKYFYKNTEYALPQHGFARDMEFSCLASEDEKAVLVLKSNKDTKLSYPFDFVLRITYSLIGNAITTEYSVINTGNEIMYFSVGGHPGLCLFDPINDYKLIFEQKEQLIRRTIIDGLLNEEELEFGPNTEELKLSEELVSENALLFKNMKSRSLSLVSDNSWIIFSWVNMPYLALWKKSKAAFICIEPWSGITDSIASNQLLEEKEGINLLNSKEEFQCSYTINLFN